MASTSSSNGAEVDEVGEHLHQNLPVISFELESYPEPKALTQDELKALHGRLKSYYRVADLISASEAFARLNARTKCPQPKTKRRRKR